MLFLLVWLVRVYFEFRCFSAFGLIINLENLVKSEERAVEARTKSRNI